MSGVVLFECVGFVDLLFQAGEHPVARLAPRLQGVLDIDDVGLQGT